MLLVLIILGDVDFSDMKWSMAFVGSGSRSSIGVSRLSSLEVDVSHSNCTRVTKLKVTRWWREIDRWKSMWMFDARKHVKIKKESTCHFLDY